MNNESFRPFCGWPIDKKSTGKKTASQIKYHSGFQESQNMQPYIIDVKKLEKCVKINTFTGL